MRRGCGCLLGLLALAIGLGTLVWAATFLLGSPEPAAGTPWTAADLSTARRKLDALRRQEGPLLEVALSERELAAIATRHLAVPEAGSLGVIGAGWQARTQVGSQPWANSSAHPSHFVAGP